MLLRRPTPLLSALVHWAASSVCPIFPLLPSPSPHAGPFDHHFVVRGFNGLYYVGAANCWAKNLHVLNADCAGEAIHSDFSEFRNISMGLTAARWVSESG